jgi:hypothetical protein
LLSWLFFPNAHHILSVNGEEGFITGDGEVDLEAEVLEVVHPGVGSEDLEVAASVVGVQAEAGNSQLFHYLLSLWQIFSDLQ